MKPPLDFTRTFSELGTGMRHSEKGQDVLDVVEDFMMRWGYSLRDLMRAGLSVEYLGDEPGRQPDIIFRMCGFEYFEIVMRRADGTVSYGGWLTGRAPVAVSDETVNGRPVVLTSARDGSRIRHIYDPVTGYRPEAQLSELPLHAVRRLAEQT